MKLSTAATYFDKQVFTDAYTGAEAFLGQMDLFNGTVRDGLTSVRSVISTAPNLAVPARRAVLLGDTVWMLGTDRNQDFFRTAPIRDNYIAHRSDGLAEVKTISQELSVITGLMAHAAAIWIKGEKEDAESSAVSNNIEVYLAGSESVPNGNLIKLNNLWYSVRYTYLTTTGFVAAVGDQLDAPNFEVASYAKRAYNALTDAHTSTPVNVKLLRIRWQEKFEYLSQASTKYTPGDDVLMVSAADVSAPTTGDLITLSDGVRRIESIQAAGDLWHLHVRRA